MNEGGKNTPLPVFNLFSCLWYQIVLIYELSIEKHLHHNPKIFSVDVI